jgi:superoxide dismutase, Cu-Zn family
MRAFAAVLASLLLAGCAAMTRQPATDTTARAELRNSAGQPVGSAVLAQVGNVVRVVLEVQRLPRGAKAVHLHAVGRCDGPDFASAGGHFNPAGRQHGALNPQGAHAGDLPNIEVGADGKGRLESTTELISLVGGTTSLFDADGSALVIHAAPDDFRTDPTGNAGARIACGIVTRK